MLGNLKKTLRLKLRESNFNRIADYITKMCDLMEADRAAGGAVLLPNNENQIRSILVEEYLKAQKENYKMMNYLFDIEIHENYIGGGIHKGRVDIRIKLKNDFEKDEAYYIVECKRLDGKSVLNRKYVEEGVARFITDDKYSMFYGKNVMLGFIVDAVSTTDVVSKIEGIQLNHSDAKLHGRMVFSSSTRITNSYYCEYDTSPTKTKLLHIFSDFSGIMQVP